MHATLTPRKKTPAASAVKRTAAGADSPRNHAQTAAPRNAVQAASAGLDGVIAAAIRAAGCKSADEFRRLPRDEQNDFLAQARGVVTEPHRDGVLLLDPKTCRRSPFNRDLDENDPEFIDLVADVALRGVLQNGVVRSVRDPENPAVVWEIIAGEGRWEAAKRSGRLFPAAVREADDTEALEIQAVENMKRRNLNPIDEARKFEQLRAAYETEGMSRAKALARIHEKTGKSESVIYERLSLLKLPDAVQEATRRGTLPASHAGLLTKIDDPAEQEKQATEMLRAGITGGETMSFRDAKSLVDVVAGDLDREKKWQERTAKYREEGLKVLTLAQSAKVFHYGQLKAGYIAIDDKCPLDAQGRTWKVLLTKLGEDGRAVVAHNRHTYGSTDKSKVVYPRKTAEKLLAEAGVVKAAAVKVDPAEARRQAEEKERQQRAAQHAKDEMMIGAIVAAAEGRELNAATWQFLVALLMEISGMRWHADPLLQRRGIIKTPLNTYDGLKREMGKLTAKADGKRLRGAFVELLLWSHAGQKSDIFTKAAKVFGVKVPASGKPPKPAKARGRLTPEERGRIVAAMQARWAAKKAGK